MKKHYLFIIIAAILLAGASALGFYTLTQMRKTAAAAPDEAALEEAIGVDSVQVKDRTITSSLGFRTQYDATMATARAQVTHSRVGSYVSGEEFDGDDLDETRNYSMFKFSMTAEDVKTKKLILEQELVIGTNINEDFFESAKAKPENAGLSEMEIVKSFLTKTQLENSFDNEKVTVSDSTEVVINGVTYQKFTVTHTRVDYDLIETKNWADYYITVQNGRPYWAHIDNITDTTTKDTAAFEAIIAGTSYHKPGETSEQAADTVTPSVPKGSSYTPQKISTKTMFDVVLKNQIAVVRVGTIHCADITLGGSATLTINHACTAGVGSGSIVSSDGYIATNGHVTQLGDAGILTTWLTFAYQDGVTNGSWGDIERYVDYLAKAGVVPGDKSAAFLSNIKAQDQQALEALGKSISYITNIDYRSPRTTYAIQTSDVPMKLTMEKGKDFTFNYSKTIKEATHIASNYKVNVDINQAINDNVSDVSILKMKGTFPIVTLGSVSSVKPGDRVVAVGYPAFVDGGLMTEKRKTVPAVTRGKVNYIGPASSYSSYILIQTSVPIAGGNSGGPAFNDDGEQIGLNTYGQIMCADQQCFGDGTARDIADYKALAKEEGITFEDGDIARRWNEGVEALQVGDYTRAASRFDSVAQDYPDNYLVSSLQKYADKNKPALSPTQMIMLLVAVGLMVVGAVVLVVMAILLARRHRHTSQQPMM